MSFIHSSAPEDAEDSPITAWLAPADVDVLATAGRKLESDDSHTAQARFRLLRVPQAEESEDQGPRPPGPTYIECEGIGMLMRDRDTGEPSHTMWVVKPVLNSQIAVSSDHGGPGPSAGSVPEEPFFSALASLSNETILCRICERQVPAWFFEKHNETCSEVHRLEADISLVNEKIMEMKKVVGMIKQSLEDAIPGEPAMYQGLTVSTRAKSAPQHAVGPILLAVRRIQQTHLESTLKALTSACAISTPSVKDEDSTLSISYAQLLSPSSEDRLTFIGRWVMPDSEDPALQLLFSHVDDLIRRKQTTVNRMRNTIMYAERVRRDWEDKMDHWLSQAEEDGSQSGSANGSEEDARSEEDAQIHSLSDHGKEQTNVDTAVELSPRSAKRRMIDPKARLPPTTTVSQRNPQQREEGTGARTDTRSNSGSSARPNMDRTALASPRLNTPKRLSSSSRSQNARATMEAPMSPRLPSVASMARVAPTSIKDFDIIKPISRGAFGSVYLAKKRTTGDYFAIKALKKSDMIAKNQITNVKAERTILMNQASSPYVARLYFSFQNKDYLYLVLEYLNGGDCATLVKTLGGLPEEWSRNYIAEVILGLESLHERGIIHR